jgi:hypothetical protein
LTNTGFVRPLDAVTVSYLKQQAVIPLMWDTWEYRESDLDLCACHSREVMVLGTNERDDRLRTFEHVGTIAVKLLLEMELELVGSSVIIVGGGEFGRAVASALAGSGANVFAVCQNGNDHLPVCGRVCSGSLSEALPFIRQSDALVFAEHEREDCLVGNGGEISVQDLLNANPGIKLVHISGHVDIRGLVAAGLEVNPACATGKPRVMSVTTAYIGPKPVVDLHAAGLKVGQIMARARRESGTYEEALARALQDPLCRDFSAEQKRRFHLA